MKIGQYSGPVVLFLIVAVVPATAAPAEAPAWVAQSDRHTEIVTAMFAEYLPEIMGASGVTGVDEEVIRLSPERVAQSQADGRRVVETLRRKLSAEKHPAVRQDLEILIDVVERDLELTEVEERLMLRYFDIPEQVFRGIRALLDEQEVPEQAGELLPLQEVIEEVPALQAGN